MNTVFANSAKWVAAAIGSPLAFILASATVVVWVATGPVFGYSQNW